MTINAQTGISDVMLGDGANLVFPFGFKVGGSDELVVYVNGELVDAADYSVDLSDGWTGDVTFDVAPANDAEVVIASDPDFIQSSVHQRQGPFYPDVVEDDLDRAALRDIYLKREFGRAFVLPLFNSTALAGKFPIVMPDGTQGFSFGTGADAGLREDLAGVDGADFVGFTGNGVDAEARTAQDKLRETVSIIDYRTVLDANDTAAFEKARNYLASVGGGIIRCPAGRGLGTDGSYLPSGTSGFAMTASNITLEGDGEDATLIWNPTANQPAVTIINAGTITNVELRGMTVKSTGVGADATSEAFLLSGVTNITNLRWTRVTFQGDPAREYNATKLIITVGSLHGFLAVDVTMRDTRRMGVEVVQHRHELAPALPDPAADVSTAAYTNVVFIRPRCIDITGGTYPYAMSFSGCGAGLYIERPYFENCEQLLIELVGISAWHIKDVLWVRDASTVSSLISATNFIPTLNGVLDGFFAIPAPDADNGATLAQKPTDLTTLRAQPFRFDNIDGLHVTNVRIKQDLPAGAGVMRFGVNYASGVVQLSHNRIETNAQYVVVSEGTTLISLSNNRLKSTFGGGGIEFLRLFDGTGATRGEFHANNSVEASSSYKKAVAVGGATVKVDGGYAGSTTYDAPSIAAGAQVSFTVTVPGAAVGDLVMSVSFSVSTAGLMQTAQVTAANTATVWLDNNTAGAIDLASATVNVFVMPSAGL